MNEFFWVGPLFNALVGAVGGLIAVQQRGIIKRLDGINEDLKSKVDKETCSERVERTRNEYERLCGKIMRHKHADLKNGGSGVVCD